MRTIESRFVTGPSDILFGGVYVCTFPQPGIFTGCGSEGAVNVIEEDDSVDLAKRHFVCDMSVGFLMYSVISE